MMSLASQLLGWRSSVPHLAEEEDTFDSVGARRRLLQSNTGGWSAQSSKLTEWKGYSILSGGTTEQYSPPPSFIGRRYVANTNKVVGGLLLHQVRNDRVNCTGKHAALGAPCRAKEPSTKPFGVDPVFRRPPAGQADEEALYNVELEDFVGDYYNVSKEAGKMRAGNVPFGFHYRDVPGYPKGFPVYIDIAATRDQTARMIQYLKEGLFFDPLTRSVSAQAVTYNPNKKQLANVKLEFEFNDAGYITVQHRITNMNVKWYTENNDVNGDGINDGYVQLALEFVLCMMIAYAVYCEVTETLGEIFEEKSVYRGLRLHFLSFWNILDAGNLVLQVLAMLVWAQYQLSRRSNLFPILRFDVYDNPVAPFANFFMPKKIDPAHSKGPGSATGSVALDNRTIGIAGATAAPTPAPTDHRWQLPDDISGMQALGQSMTTIQELSDLLTLYFTLTGISLLLMIARSLKMLHFQRHLDLTVRTLNRSGLDLIHFMLIFLYTLLCSSMVAIVMLGSTNESFSTIDKAFNFHFELIIGEGIDVFSELFAGRTVVRSEIEYFTLVLYSFGVPAFFLFVLVNLILGIVGDAFGEEKENLQEINEPTIFDDLSMSMNYRLGRLLGWHPSYTKLIQILRVLRKPKPPSKAAEALAKGIGAKLTAGGGGNGEGGGGGGGLLARLKDAGMTGQNEGKKSAKHGAMEQLAMWGKVQDLPGAQNKVFKRVDTFMKPNPAALSSFASIPPAPAGASSDLSKYDVPVKGGKLGSLFSKKKGLASLAKTAALSKTKIEIPDNLKPKAILPQPRLSSGNTAEASQRAKAGWAVVKKKGVQANNVFRAMGINLAELSRKNPMEQARLAMQKGGAGLLLDVMKTARDEDSDSDSSIDEDVKERRRQQNKLRGKPTAWSAIKQHVRPPVVNPNPEWQNLMDDTWREFMGEVKQRQADEAEAKMFRLNKVLYTEEEVLDWLEDAELDAQRTVYGEDEEHPGEEFINKVIKSICKYKVQQFQAEDSDEEEEQEELDELISQVRTIKDRLTKMRRFVKRELTWQGQTQKWQERVASATEKVEEELVVTHQVMSDIAKKVGAGGASVSQMKGLMRERMWATLQAKRALREALLHAPGMGRGGAALDILAGRKASKWDNSGAPAAAKGGAEGEVMKTNPLLKRLARKSGGPVTEGHRSHGGLMTRWQLAKLGAQVEIAKNRPMDMLAAVRALKLDEEIKNRKEKPKDLSKARTNPVSSFRRHRIGKKEKEEAKKKLRAYD